MWELADRLEIVEDAEIALLTSGTRLDHLKVDRMLHVDFVEIGRSGRRWSREEILSGLAAEDARETPATDEWRFNLLAPGLVLVTYRLTSGGRSSRHSSIWDVSGVVPTMRFHQGTTSQE